MNSKDDVLQIEILDDGTIKTTTDKISMANHSNAEEFLRFVARQTGGQTTRAARHGARKHLHLHHGDDHPHSH